MNYDERRLIKEKIWTPWHNGEEILVELEWIKRYNRKINQLLLSPFITENKGVFFYRKNTFNSTLLTEKCDLIFTNRAGEVIKLFPSFDTGKETGVVDNVEFLYVFQRGFIKINNIKLNDQFVHKRKRSF